MQHDRNLGDIIEGNLFFHLGYQELLDSILKSSLVEVNFVLVIVV